MNCSQVKENLSAYIDNELTDEEIRTITNHLADCAICQEEYEYLKKTVDILSSLEEVVPPARFRRELRTKLKQEAAASTIKEVRFVDTMTERLKKIAKNFNRTAFIPAAVMLVLLIVFIPSVFNSFRMGSSMQNMTKDSAPLGKGGFDDHQFTSEEILTEGIDTNKIMTTQKREIADNQKMIETTVSRKIIKNANVSLLVDNYQDTAQKVKKLIEELGGYLTSENVRGTEQEGVKEGYLQVRLPQTQFEAFLAGIEAYGRIEGRNIFTQDVTEEYIDLESRLRVLRTKEVRLLEILNKSGNLNDVLAVENELANTRAQLESLEGRLRYLNNRTEMSSIDLDIRENKVATTHISTNGLSGLLSRSKEAFIRAVNRMMINLSNLIVRISAALPYLIILTICLILVWRWYKKARK